MVEIPINMGNVILTRCRATEPSISLAFGEFINLLCASNVGSESSARMIILALDSDTWLKAVNAVTVADHVSLFSFDANFRPKLLGGAALEGPMFVHLRARDIQDASYRSRIYREHNLIERISWLGCTGHYTSTSPIFTGKRNPAGSTSRIWMRWRPLCWGVAGEKLKLLTIVLFFSIIQKSGLQGIQVQLPEFRPTESK